MYDVLPLLPAEKAGLDVGFLKAFGCQPARYFSAPGRTEISGNHTDHQQGCVLAAAVDLHTRAAVRPNGTDCIRIQSKGYPLTEIMLTSLSPVEAEKNTTSALVRGVAARFVQLGCKVCRYFGKEVPRDMVESFRKNVENAIGKGACHILSVRPQGGVEIKENC